MNGPLTPDVRVRGREPGHGDRERRSEVKIRCDAADQADFGYGDPEVFYCEEPATHRGWDRTPWSDRERVHVCSWHAKRARGVRLYRFRSFGRAGRP